MDAPLERAIPVGSGVFDPLRGELALGGRTTRLRPRTAALLAHLVRNRDRVVTKDELLEVVWPDVVVTEDSLVQCVKEARQAFGPDGHDWIRTVPRQGYAFVGGAEPAAPVVPRTSRRAWLAAGAGALAIAIAIGSAAWRSRPQGVALPGLSIVVLPFSNATGDAKLDALAQDVGERLADSLTKSRQATVIAPATAAAFKDGPVDVRSVGAALNVHFVLQGTLRALDGQRVLGLRLAETDGGTQVWQQEFTLEPDFRQQLREDRSRTGITPVLWDALTRAHAARSGKSGPIEAAELVSRARELLATAYVNPKAAPKARELLEVAVERNDKLATGWVYLALACLDRVHFSATRDEQLACASRAAARAVALAPDHDSIRIVQGLVLQEQGRGPEALAQFDRALDLNPANAAARGYRARSLLFLGRPRETLAELDRATQLSPRDPLVFFWMTVRGVAYMHLAQDSQAVGPLARVAEIAHNEPLVHAMLAAALANDGHREEAHAHAKRALELMPGFTVARFRASESSTDPAFVEQREHVYAGMRAAGLPAE